MIYRATDCGCYSYPNAPSVELWFEAGGDNDAHTRAERILSLLWAVPVEDVCLNGMPSSEISLERNSMQDRAAGDRRWLESGSHGEYVTYGGGPSEVLVFLSGIERKRYERARAAALAHAREVLADMKADDPKVYGLTVEYMERFIAEGDGDA